MNQGSALDYGVIKVKKRYWLRFVDHSISVPYEARIAWQNQVNVALTKMEFDSIKSQLIKVTLTRANPEQLLNFNITRG